VSRVLGSCFVIAAIILGISPVRSQGPAPGEYEVKAAFLYNFLRYTEWPADANPGPGVPLLIGVLGDESLDRTLGAVLRGKTVQGRLLEVRRVRLGPEARVSHLLFVSASERVRVGQVLDAVRGAPVLTVGETDGFAQAGGVINFVLEEGRVRFEVNQEAAQRARLRLSSRLLALARIVR
jgi:hypothetical protein